MADPISVTGLVIAIGGLVQALVNHASYVKDAKKEIQELTTELFALKGVLEHIECQQKAASADVGPSQPSKYSSQEFLRMLESTGELLEALSKRLKPAQSRFGQSVQRMTWSFKRDEVQKQISRVERVKTWLVIVMTADNVWVVDSNRIYGAKNSNAGPQYIASRRLIRNVAAKQGSSR